MTAKVAIVGAGIGGLSAALLLANRGLDVVVLERTRKPGGKMREVTVGGAAIDAGPTVFTMRWVFDEMFAEAGASLDDHIRLRKTDLLARHAWSPDQRLDLFCRSSPLGGRDRQVCRSGGGTGISRILRAQRACLPDPARHLHQGPAAERLLAHPGRGPAWPRRPRPHLALRNAVAGTRRIFPRPAPAPIVRPLCHLLRLVPVSRTRHPDAGRSCGAGRRMARRRRHAARRRRAGDARPGARGDHSVWRRGSFHHRRARRRSRRDARDGRTHFRRRRGRQRGFGGASCRPFRPCRPQRDRRAGARGSLALGGDLRHVGRRRRLPARAPQRVLLVGLPRGIRGSLHAARACPQIRRCTFARRAAPTQGETESRRLPNPCSAS